MKKLIIILFSVISISAFAAGRGKVITKFQDIGSKKVALTFDACQSKTPAFFDKTILDYIIANKIPVSIFLQVNLPVRTKRRSGTWLKTTHL